MRRTRSQLGPQRQDTDVEFLFVRRRPVTPDFRSQQLPHDVLAVLSEDTRVQRVQDVDRHGFWTPRRRGRRHCVGRLRDQIVSPKKH